MRRSRTIVSLASATTMLTSALVVVAIPVSASPPASGPGALDTSFGINGSGVAGLARPAGAGALRALDRMVVEPDGRILVGALDATSHKTYVYRLTAGGIADSGFNGGSPIIVSQALASPEDTSAIGADAAGNIYVGGGYDAGGHSALFINRYKPSGAFDTTWANGGTFHLDLNGSFAPANATDINDHVTDIAFDSSGNLVATAWVGQAGGADFVTLRLTPDGALDTSFGNGPANGIRTGYASTDFNSGDDTARSLAIQPDGKIVVAGFAKVSGGGSDDFGLVRYNADGIPDSAFGSAGKVQSDFSAGHDDGAWSVVVGADGVITAAGTDYFDSNGVVARYSGSDGHLEPSFASVTSGGHFRSSANASNYSVALDPDGRILTSGPGVTIEGPVHGAVERLVDDAYPLDTTWNSSGDEALDCAANDTGGAAVATTASGQVLFAFGCGDDLSVSQLRGGNDVPIPSSVADGSAGDVLIHVSNVSVNNGGNTANVAGGASYTVSLSYDVFQSAAFCPGCIDQIQVGYPNAIPTVCAYDGEPGGGNTVTGTFAGSFVAPNKPGIYYLGVRQEQDFGCTSTIHAWTAGQPTPAQFIAKIHVGGVTSVQLSADVSQAPAGHLATPVTAVPGTALQAVGAQLQSAPLRSTPLRSTPLRSTPLRSTPLRSTPLRSTPLRSTPLPIALSDAPLVSPKNWADVLAQPGSNGAPNPFANQPLQNVTLQQVLALIGYPAIDALTMADIDWGNVLAGRNLSIAAFLLGDTPIGRLAAPAAGWCTFLAPKPLNCGTAGSAFLSSHSLADLQLQGDDVSDYLTATPITLSGVTLVNSALARMLLQDIQLDQTPYSTIAAGSYASCSSCTFAAAEAGSTLSNTATLGGLLADTRSDLPAVTLGDLLPGIIPPDEMPYDAVPLTTVVNASPIPSAGLVSYTATVGLVCQLADTLTIQLRFPAGFRYIPNTAGLAVGGTPVPAASLTVASTPKGTTVSAPNTSCANETQAVLTAKAEPGIQLGGPFSASASATYGGTTLSSGADAPVTVLDNPPPGTAVTNTIYLGHIGQPGEADLYTINSAASGLQPGTQITASLTNVPPGQDYDLVVFGPAAPDLRSSPLRSTPLRSTPLRSTGVPDTTGDPTSDGTLAQPDPQADVPTTPPTGQVFRASSLNRGSANDSIVTTVGDGETGNYTVQVSGYNGSSSPSPYMLRITATPAADSLPCAPLKPSTGQGVAGSLPTTPLPPSTQTLLLVDKKRLGDFYGSTGANNVMTALQTLAARSDVQGVVVPVEGDSVVAGAYTAWDGTPCSPAAADGVVAAINGLVDRLRGGLNQLRNIVIVGDDQIIPMARVADHTVVSNESDYAQAAAVGGMDNAESRALADGYLLSDDAYGSFNPIPWMESQLYVPNVALGRLVETPDDITNAINAFVSAGGVRTPTAGFTTGYDFMTSEAQGIDTALRANLPKVNASASTPTSQINSTWTKTDAVSGVTTAAHGLIALNAHYDQYRALPANEFAVGTQTQLLTTADLPTSMTNSIMFTIGCHAGLNLADTFVASPTAAQAARLNDWAQAVSAKGGQLVGNTGFGYGDTQTVAYSAALMTKLAQNLNGTMTVGQALMFAKQGYLHLPMGVYDAKATQEATFYGLPMYRLGASGAVAPPALPPAQSAPPTVVTTTAGSPSTALFGGTSDLSLVARSTADGTYYVVHHGTANTDEQPLVVQNEPVEPQTTVNVGPRSDGLVAHGVTLDSLSTSVTSAAPTFNPVFDKPTVDLSQFSPEPQIASAFFPATIDGLVSTQTPAGPRDTVVLTPGQFRSDSLDRGFQVLASSMGYHLNYSNSSNFSPPTIGSTAGVVSSDGTHVTFTVSVTSGDAGGVTDVTILYLAAPSTAPQAWTKVTLAQIGSSSTWSATLPYTGPPTIGQYLVQATDGAGNVAESANKGQDFSAAQAPAAAAGAPTVSVAGASTNGVFTVAPTVSLDGGAAPLSYSTDNGAFKAYTGPFTVSGDGTHTVTALDSAGSASTATISISTSRPTVRITAPANGATYMFSRVPTPTFSCTSPLGISSCVPSPTVPTQLQGTNTFSVTATDAATRTTTSTVTYTVTPEYAFAGFYSPLPNLGANSTVLNVAKGGSSIPLKFNLTDNANNGAVVSDVAIITNVAQGKVTCSSSAPTDPVDYTVATTTSGLKWDASAGQFVYVWNTAKSVSGTCQKITFTFADGTTASSLFKFS